MNSTYFPQKNAWMSVPQFGGWDHKGATDYSMVFSRARANKKQQKNGVSELKRAHLGNEGPFIATRHEAEPTPRHQDDSVMVRY